MSFVGTLDGDATGRRIIFDQFGMDVLRRGVPKALTKPLSFHTLCLGSIVGRRRVATHRDDWVCD